MMRSLWTAASGMKTQQITVDVIANNLANVNTTAFKTEDAEFKNLLYQTIQAKTTTKNGVLRLVLVLETLLSPAFSVREILLRRRIPLILQLTARASFRFRERMEGLIIQEMVLFASPWRPMARC